MVDNNNNNSKSKGCVADKLNLREKFIVKFVELLEFVLGVDYLNSYWRIGVYYDDWKDHDVIKMEYPSDLKDEWLELYRQRSEEHDSFDYVPYCAWLVMRDDDIINPDTIVSFDTSGDEPEVDVDNGPREEMQKERKKEILLEMDKRGFIDPVLEENKDG